MSFRTKILLAIFGLTCASDSYAASVARNLAAGTYFSVQVNPDATVSAWGENTLGQLGDGTTLMRSAPVLVKGLAGVSHVSSGSNHTLALTTDGKLFAWGTNVKGQLGIGGTKLLVARPSVVASLPTVRHASAYGDTSGALDTAGNVWLWGSAVNSSVPIKISGALADVGSASAIALGGTDAAVVLTDGAVIMWTLSQGTNPVPLTVKILGTAPFRGVTRISGARNLHFGVTSDGKAWEIVPGYAKEVIVAAGKTIVDVSASGNQTAWLTSDGAIYMTGENSTGQYGNGSLVSAGAPSRVANTSTFSAVAAGEKHTIASTTTQQTFAWGYNAFGELGTGSRQYVAEPLQSISLSGFAAIAPGRKHTLGVSPASNLAAWGSNEFAQTGIFGATDIVRTPTTLATSFPLTDAVAGQTHSVALAPDGGVYAWGDNSFGQVGIGGSGIGAIVDTPTKVVGLPATKFIATGITSTLAVTTNGELFGWGRNGDGILATGATFGLTATPVQALSLPAGRRYATVVAGRAHAAAIADDGSLWMWGDNSFRQLATASVAGTASPIAGPFAATTRPKSLAVTAGYNSTLALQADGTVWIWGETSLGRDVLAAATQVNGLPKVSAIAASGYTYAALGEDGSLWTWGRNTSPTPAPFLSHSRFARLGAGAFADSLFARDIDGRWWTLGYNAYGQLGFGGDLNLQEVLPVSVYDAGRGTSNSSDITEFFTDQVGPADERYFLSADVRQSALLDTLKSADGTYFWNRTGRGFRAWPTAQSAPTNASEVYRFYCLSPDGKPNTHFYTANAADKIALAATNPTNEVGKGCRYEGVAFYAVAPNYSAYTNAATANMVEQSCPTGYQPVYRAFNNRVALNDGNHRMSTSWIDHVRSVRYLGYIDEGVVFCSPTSTVAGGDLHAYHAHPGPEVKSGDRLKVEYLFANNGPGQSDNARIIANIPTAVADWSVACIARLGAVCPSPITVDGLRSGMTIYRFPAGGTINITLTGTAPAIAATNSSTIELRFANSIESSATAPDLSNRNNTTQTSATQVKGTLSCTYGLTANQVSIAAGGGTTTTTVATNANCPITPLITVAEQGGQPIAPSSVVVASQPNGSVGTAISANNLVKLNVSANPGPLSRRAVLNVNGQTLTLFQDAPLVPAPTVPVVANCITQLIPPSEHAAATGYSSRSVTVSTVTSACQWSAKPNVDWINILATASATGAGALTYTVQPNTSLLARSGKVTIGNSQLEIFQEPGSEASVPDAGGAAGGDGGGDGNGGGGSGGGGEGPGGD